MEKRKRKPKDDRFPIEFISPYSLEECIQRIPTKLVTCISQDTYEFYLNPNINDNLNQFVNVYGYLQRESETTTLILGEAKLNPILYIFSLAVIPFIAIGFSKFVGNAVTPIFFIALIEGLILYFLRHTKKRLSQSIFEIFKPKRKAKEGSKYQHQTLLFPWRSFNFEVDLPVSSCAVQLQQAAFWPTLCRVTAIDEQECHFDISGLFGNWTGIKAIGIIIRDEVYTSRVKGKVGLTYIGYWQAFFMIILLAVLAKADSRWLSSFPIALVIFPTFIFLVGFFNIFAFRRKIKRALSA
jgi:hypothetical protein